MKYLTLILLICVSSFSLNKIVIPNRAAPNTVISSSKTNENLDTIASKVNKLIDSLDQKFPRFTDYSSGDSILRSKRADFDTTVSDTMYNSGGLYSERVSTPSAGITRINIDTSKTRHLNADSATISVFKGTKIIRDSSAFTGGVNIARVWTPQLNITNATAGRVVITDASRNLSSSTVTATELGLLLNKNSVIDGSGTSGNIPVFTGTNRLGNGPVWNSGTSTMTGNITGNAATATITGNAATATRSDSLSKPFYTDTTFNDSLYEGGVWTGTYATVRLVKIGKMCMLFQPQMITTSSGGLLTINGIPSKYLTTLSATGGIVTTIRNNGTDTNGLIWFYNGAVRIHKEDGTNTDAGTSGITSSFLYWITF